MMFDRFASAFSLLPAGQRPAPPFAEPFLRTVTGYDALTSRFAGCMFENGLYRLFDAETGPKAAAIADAFYPAAAGRFVPFGMDWMGRLFTLDHERVVDGDPQVMLLEPGSGESFEVPYGLVSLHDEHMVDDPESPLLASFFEQWCAREPGSVPLAMDKVVGFVVPLFLGGDGTLDNVEVSDWEVYWTVVGQLKLKTAHLPEGTPIRNVSDL